ncbi:MAG TPA: RhuM family protein [Orrella sp.]
MCAVWLLPVFAVTDKTTAELIAERADSKRLNVGLITWKSGSVQKTDVTVVKNIGMSLRLANLIAS